MKLRVAFSSHVGSERPIREAATGLGRNRCLSSVSPNVDQYTEVHHSLGDSVNMHSLSSTSYTQATGDPKSGKHCFPCVQKMVRGWLSRCFGIRSVICTPKEASSHPRFIVSTTSYLHPFVRSSPPSVRLHLDSAHGRRSCVHLIRRQHPNPYCSYPRRHYVDGAPPPRRHGAGLR